MNLRIAIFIICVIFFSGSSASSICHPAGSVPSAPEVRRSGVAAAATPGDGDETRSSVPAAGQDLGGSRANWFVAAGGAVVRARAAMMYQQRACGIVAAAPRAGSVHDP